MRLYHCSLVVGLVGALAACGGHVGSDPTNTNGSGTPGDSTDSGTTVVPSGDTGTVTPSEDAAPAVDTAPPPPPVDHGAPSDKYPAFPSELPELSNNGGDVLSTPVVVTVTFPGEPLADKYEAFGDALGATDYWKQITSEYGVKAAISGSANHVRNAEALPATIADTEIETYIADHVKNHDKYKWPAPTDQSIYVLYIPTTTNFQLQGSDVCGSGVGGYHTSVSVDGKEVAYAILPQCPGGGGGGGSLLDETTLSSSHEIGEAALDPHPQGGSPGYAGVDDNHVAWELFMQGNSENGDLCEIYRDSFYRPSTGGGLDASFDFVVQRQWSNASGKAGHNPCVPVPTGAYYNVAPLAMEDVTIDLSGWGGGTKFKSKGYHIGVGETKSFDVGFYSDAATTPWNIKGYEGGAFGPAKTKRLEVSIDKTSGQNGEKAHVTVKVLTLGKQKGEVVTIVSSQGSKQHFMPILIGSE